jgi:peptidoglycan/LPS O-acetylase OafA/YrhL
MESNPQERERHAPFHIPSLDGLRAAAVLLVFVAHAGLQDRIPGNFGVTVFFFLSGYLITTLLRLEYDVSGGISLRAFYARRALRILPPMYLVLIGASLITVAGAWEGSLSAGAVLAQALHLSNYYIINAGWWDGRAPGTWIYWSLAIEEHFYLVFPVFYLLLRRYLPSRRQQMLALLGICAAVLLWRLALVYGFHAPKDRTYLATDTRIDSILFGCVLAVWGNPALDTSRVGERWWRFVWLPLGIAALLISFAVKSPQFQQTFRYSLQGVALFPVFVVAISSHDWAIFRVLNVGWVKFLGVLSYSVYLLHPSVLFGIWQWTNWHPLVQGAAGFAVTVCLAVAIYYAVERPCARLRKQFSRVGMSAPRLRQAHAVTASGVLDPVAPSPLAPLRTAEA